MSIRLKLIAWITILFILIGILIYVPLSHILPQKIISQILKRDIEIAKYISEQAKDCLLFDRKIALSLLLRENLDRLEDAQYLFLEGADGNILSHTFAKEFPRGLLFFNRAAQSSYRVKEFTSAGKRIYDIAIPLLRGELGVLHLGVSLESGKKDIAEMAKINYYVAVVILVVLGIGISIFLTAGLLFSRQIIKLKNFTTVVGRGNFDTQIDIHSNDEIGTLAQAFNEMAKNLKEKIQEIKRLNSIEERNRIALDLHDGCAQDMANIIKRIELCEKLFLHNQKQAFEELNALKESTKELLHNTRGVIFDLKSSESLHADLARDITDYVNKYRTQNNINVALTISDACLPSRQALSDVPKEKSKDIFYIIIEALNNIKKHSQAENVQLLISRDSDRNVIIDIKDDGEGFDISDAQPDTLQSRKLGLTSMRQRAKALGGTISISSELNKGTDICVRVPIIADWMGL